jgi:hypothetical protein
MSNNESKIIIVPALYLERKVIRLASPRRQMPRVIEFQNFFRPERIICDKKKSNNNMRNKHLNIFVYGVCN